MSPFIAHSGKGKSVGIESRLVVSRGPEWEVGLTKRGNRGTFWRGIPIIPCAGWKAGYKNLCMCKNVKTCTPKCNFTLYNFEN